MGRSLPIFIIAAATALAACGGDEKKGRTVSVDAGKPVPVVANEYSFDPARIIVRAKDAETPIELRLENEGTLAHDLSVGDEGTAVIQGGKSTGATLRLKPGTYRFICTVGDHEQLGMKGTLEVR